MSVNKMSDSERLCDENSYESSDTESDILEELVNKCKSLKRYRFELEKEVITTLTKVKMIQKPKSSEERTYSEYCLEQMFSM